MERESLSFAGGALIAGGDSEAALAGGGANLVSPYSPRRCLDTYGHEYMRRARETSARLVHGRESSNGVIMRRGVLFTLRPRPRAPFVCCCPAVIGVPRHGGPESASYQEVAAGEEEGEERGKGEGEPIFGDKEC